MENFRSPGTKVPGTFVPGTFRSRELSFSGNESSLELSFRGPFILGNFRSRRTKVPGNFRSWDLSYPGTFVPITDRPSRRFALYAKLLHVRLWLRPYVDDSIVNFSANVVRRSTRFRRPSVFVCQLASSHLYTLHSYLTEKNNTEHTLSLLSLFLENKHY